MEYKPFQEMKLSTLGMGNMRLPVTEPRGPIDEAKAREIIEAAYAGGVNYFDTAYGYHNGESERFVGKVLSQFPRDTWYLASKMPGHMMHWRNGRIEFSGYLTGHTMDSVAQIFETQLEKCGVDYFDFYMLHNLCETSIDFYMDPELGVVDYLLEQKRAGRIRHLGISAHGRTDTIDRFLTWRNCFEFVQLQLNYLDWTLQDARGKYEVVTKHGLPVIVMEPVRGGSLIHLDSAAEAVLLQARPTNTMAAWAFRFLQSLPNVQVVLSGMTTMEQLRENLDLFSHPAPLNTEERALLDEAVSLMFNRVPCTACRYCCDACPQHLDIPKLLSMYDEMRFSGKGILSFTLGAMTSEEMPSACMACGECMPLCPQGIDIPDVMQKFATLLAAK